MLLGIALVLFPFFPGILLVFGGTLFYGFLTNFEKINLIYILIFGSLTIISFLFDWISGIMGGKFYGTSRAGIYGGLLGIIIAIPTGLIGIVFIPVITTILAEILFDKNLKRALRAGWGTFIGYLIGIFGKLIFGLTIIIIFLIRTL